MLAVPTETRPPLLSAISLQDFRCPALRRPVDNSFYSSLTRRVAKTCGHGSGFSDYHSVMESLNKDLDLDLDHTTNKVLSLLLHGLSRSNRWAGSLHISSWHGENSAIHSVMSAVLLNELFRRAEFLNVPRSDVQNLRVVATLALLVHDMGELAGEFNTVESRTLFNNKDEERILQRKVFECALRFAVTHLDSPEEYYEMLADLRRHTNANSTLGTFRKEDLSCAIEKKWTPDNSLNSSARLLVSRLLYVYDLVEFHDHKNRDEMLIGLICEAAEHVQGTRHLCRFAPLPSGNIRPRLWDQAWKASFDGESSDSEQNEKMLSLRLRNNKEFYRMFAYTEGEVSGIMRAAQSDIEKALAWEAQKMVYLTLAEISLMGPKFLLCDNDCDIVQIKDLRIAAFAKGTDANSRRALLKQIEAKLIEEKEILGSWYGGQECSVKPPHTTRIVTGAEIAAVYEEAVRQKYIPHDKEILLYSPSTFDRLLKQAAFIKTNNYQQTDLGFVGLTFSTVRKVQS